MQTGPLRRVLALAMLALCAGSARAGGAEIAIDDFEQAGQLHWREGSAIPVGGRDRPLAIVEDPERKSNVLRARVRYVSGPIFISRTLEEPIPLWKCKAISFRYRFSTSKLSADKALICRLRTGPRSSTDFVVATSKTIEPGKWVRAEIDASSRRRPVNLYRSFFSTAKWMTLRLDGEPGAPVDLEFRVDDIEIELKEPTGRDYKPQIVAKPQAPDRRDVLIIKNSAAAYYNFEDVVRSLPVPTSQRVLKFRGLHFPIFGFPRTRAELMRFALIVFVDVDPYVLPMQHVQWLSDFAASGGGLLFCGGPNTFGYSQDFKRPLADLLPVEITPESDLVSVSRAPRLLAKHPITTGIPPRLGKVAKAHLLRARPGATVLLDIPQAVPPNWGYYSGGNPRAAELLAASDAHTGKQAAALVTRDFYHDPKTGKPLWISVALIQGSSDGYSGPAAYPARPSTRYDFSFWLKGDVPAVKVECIGWKTAEAKRADRYYIDTSVGTVRPAATWQRHDGSFTTRKDTRRFALAFRVHGNPQTLKLGQRIVVDDVVIQPYGSTRAVSLNGGCEDVPSLPLLAVGTFHRGRTAVLNACPDVAETLEGDFFTSDSYDDLMRQTLGWLVRHEPTVAIERFSPPPRHVLGPLRASAKLVVKLGAAQKAKVICRTVRDGQQVARKEVVVAAGAAPLARFHLKPDGFFGLDSHSHDHLTFEVRDADGKLQALRTCTVTRHAFLDSEIRIRYGKLVTAPGKRLRFRVWAGPWPRKGGGEGDVLDATASIVDPATKRRWRLPRRPMRLKHGGSVGAELAFDLPDLSDGECVIFASVFCGFECWSTASQRFHVVGEVDRSTFYPIMSIVGGGGGHQADPELVRERIDDLLAHGFNVAAVGGVRHYREWDEQSHRRAMSNLTEAYAQRNGMALIYEYESYTNIRRDRPVKPCVHAPGYREALRQHVEPYLEVGSTVPRLISIKVLDEPHAGPKTMDYCEHCRRAWRERFGTEMPKAEGIPKNDLVARKQYIEFVRDYVAKGYRIGHELKAEANAPWDLLLTYCSPAYGRSTDLMRSQEDLFWWAETADRIDFDVYPYFYPVSEKIRFLQAHFCMALMRNVAQHQKKPWGFYVELDDRNYPIQVNPVEASSECALTAVAHGADYLNSFINRTFGTGNQARPERWDHLGNTLKQFRAAGPLLIVAKTPRARLALLFPYTHWQLSRQRWTPYYAYQLLLRAFGECDILHEEVARREGGFSCKALALLQTDYLPDDVAGLIADFVRNGGMLLCDRVPRFNGQGGPCKLPAGMFAKPPSLPADLATGQRTFGKGQTLLLAPEVEEAFDAAVSSRDLRRRRKLRATVRALLFERGLRPRVLAADPEVDIGYREAKDTIVLTAVNHGAKDAETTLTLFSPPFDVGYLADPNGREHALRKTKHGVETTLKLPARCGRLLVAYPARPARLRLDVLTPAAKRCGRLQYRVTAVAEDGSTCKGHFLAPLRVTDPQGRPRQRYAPAGVTTHGVRELSIPVAINAPTGEWRITLPDLFARQTRTGKFEVR